MHSRNFIFILMILLSACDQKYASVDTFSNDSDLYLNPTGEVWEKQSKCCHSGPVDPYNPPATAKKHRYGNTYGCFLNRSEMGILRSTIGGRITSPNKPVWDTKIIHGTETILLGTSDGTPVAKVNSDFFFMKKNMSSWAAAIELKCIRKHGPENTIPQ